MDSSLEALGFKKINFNQNMNGMQRKNGKMCFIGNIEVRWNKVIAIPTRNANYPPLNLN